MTTTTPRTFVYFPGIDMARIPFTPLQDLDSPVDARELPLYSRAELAYLFNLPESTLRSWAKATKYKGRTIAPLIAPADPKAALYSFYNLVEAHILSLTTRVHGCKTKYVRRATELLQNESLHDLPHPLLSQEFHTDGRHIWLKQLEKRLDLSQNNQLGMASVLDSYLERIDRDELFRPNKIYPGRQKDKIVSITPAVSSGRLIIEGTGVPVSSIWNRFKAGDSKEFIADDFDIPLELIQGAVNYVERLSVIS